MNAVLNVPVPTLKFDDAGGGTAALEKPVSVLLSAVTEAGVPLAASGVKTSGFSITRRAAPGALVEVWDDAAKAWTPDKPGTVAKPIAMTYKEGDPNLWQGLLVAAGLKDGTGAPAFGKVVNGYPVYYVRGTFVGKDGVAGDGQPSAALTFVSASDANLVVLGPGDNEQPDSATQARVQLKSPSRQLIGQLLITRDSPGAAIRLENAAGASVVINSDGSIELNPAPGKGVRINGDLETEHITYLPSGSGAKQEL